MKTLEERFFKKIKKTKTCWEWTACLNHFGYGMMGLGGRLDGIERAHRVSWIIHYGVIQKKRLVLHKCDNPKCVNPKHLYIGTQKNNIDDMIKRKRYNNACGENSFKHKLTKKQVLLIKNDSRSGLVIAKEYGVTHQSIYDIKNGKSWKHLN